MASPTAKVTAFHPNAAQKAPLSAPTSAQAHMGVRITRLTRMGGIPARYHRGILLVSQAAMAVARVPKMMSTGP